MQKAYGHVKGGSLMDLISVRFPWPLQAGAALGAGRLARPDDAILAPDRTLSPQAPAPALRPQPPQVFIRERLNGYYSVATFALANTLASAPFIFGIAVISSAVVYWLVGKPRGP